jgi:hypothetical protein
MREIGLRAGRIVLVLGALLANLAIARATCPILRPTFPSLPAASAIRPKLTRHCIEEVGSKGIKLAPAVQTLLLAATRPDAPRFADQNPSAQTEPTRKICVVRRKLLPPSPWDG